MGFFRFLDGIVTVEITSADVHGTMNAIQSSGFQLWNLEMLDVLTIRFQIRRREWKKLRILCKKRGEQLRLLSKRGIYWNLLGLKQRPVLVIGLFLLMLLSFWVPGRVFFVQIEGNISIPSRQIVESAARCGISFGASRREVRSEKMKNALLEEMPSLSWAGVNTFGCTAVISVRERTESNPLDEHCEVSSIIAVRDGVIRQMTVLRGNSLCAVGQAVKAGQVLISGYNDCGISIQAVAARGEIYAETNRSLLVICPAFCEVRGVQTDIMQKFSLIIGKKRIIFSNSSGISGNGCAKIYEEKYISLPGGFCLPVAIAVETWAFYETDVTAFSNVEQVLKGFAARYLPAQMTCGKILLADEALLQQDGYWELTGNYCCYEMIGITRIEENIPEYGKND